MSSSVRMMVDGESFDLDLARAGVAGVCDDGKEAEAGVEERDEWRELALAPEDGRVTVDDLARGRPPNAGGGAATSADDGGGRVKKTDALKALAISSSAVITVAPSTSVSTS